MTQEEEMQEIQSACKKVTTLYRKFYKIGDESQYPDIWLRFAGRLLSAVNEAEEIIKQ